METRKTKTGWIIETTNRINDCLEQGGRCGREVLYTRETLEKCGIPYDSDPEDEYNDCMTHEEYLAGAIEPDRVIRRGVEIV